MSEWVFPWKPSDVLVLVHEGDGKHEILRCHSGGHGGLHQHGSMVTIMEEGWIAYAWRPDDTPAPDDARWPPKTKDWLTGEDPYP